jgi:hypothetical protein
MMAVYSMSAPVPKCMRVFFVVFAATLMFVGCCSKQPSPTPEQAGLPSESAIKTLQSDYGAALADAKKSILYAADFSRLFPGEFAGFSYYTGGAGPSSFYMEVLLFDRYELLMKVPVAFDASRRKVKSFGEPEFLLNEYSEVTKSRKVGRGPDGNPVTVENLRPGKSGDRSLRFGAVEWRKVVEARGDFAVIGFPLITNSPAPGFEDYRKDWETRRMRQP